MSDMKDHVPDLERCKRLQEMGFPQDLQFFWATDWCDAWWVVHETDLGCNDMPIPAPIVTELVGEIEKFKPETDIGMGRYILVDGKSVVWEGFKSPAALASADTLPNALADLWLAKREKGGMR